MDMESKKSYIKHHIFIAIITLAILIGLIVLTIHFFKINEMNSGFVVGFILFYLWGLTILPAGYYYFRAEANSLYQRQPKFIFFSRFQYVLYHQK